MTTLTGTLPLPAPTPTIACAITRPLSAMLDAGLSGIDRLRLRASIVIAFNILGVTATDGLAITHINPTLRIAVVSLHSRVEILAY